jgi:hypothetical protein
MENFIHRPIKRFSIDGSIYDDSYVPRLRDQYEMILRSKMRNKGFCRRMDIDAEFTLEYTGKGYEFELSLYGVYVGKRKAQWIEGLLGTRPIYIQESKLERSLLSQE